VAGRAGGAAARLARLEAVAEVPIAARRPVRDRGVPAAEHGIAGVGRARVRVVAVRRRAGGAGAGLAGLVAVADVAVGARGPVRQRRELAPRDRVTGIGRAGVAVVADERRPAGARAGLARLEPVAGV